MEQIFAEVYVELKNRRVDRTFHYRVPYQLQEQIKIGTRVTIPFGNQICQGYVVDLLPNTDLDAVKDINELLDEQPFFTAKDIQLARWMADYYLCPFVTALECMLPAGLRYESKVIIRPAASKEELTSMLNSLRFLDPATATALAYIMDQEKVTLPMLAKAFPEQDIVKALDTLRQYGVINEEKQYRQGGVRQELFARAVGDEQAVAALRTAPKQCEILKLLLQRGDVPVKELLSTCKAPRSSLNSLVDKGLASVHERSVAIKVMQSALSTEEVPSLTAEQQKIVNRLQQAAKKEQYRAFLLHGVTGSGKTEVYLRAVEDALQYGKEALVLVPEIALASQMVTRFTQRFGTEVAVIHSGLSRSERLREWLRTYNGEAKVVLGARSAIFAPLKNIGVIVVDEEHESSYKQDQAPRYHARDVAAVRARQHNALLLMGSATPALESYLSTRRQKYQLITLENRVTHKPLPAVAVVDMRQERRQGNQGIFSTALFQSLETCLNRGEQAILFLNRRGFASFLVCQRCGLSIRCPHCDIALTHHVTVNKLLCHYCGHQQPLTNHCPRCGSASVGGVGCGTQQVEMEVNKRFPQVPTVRMDVDTTQRQGAHHRLLEDFRKGTGKVLVGTQMVAKGLDFPNVTLVGVVSADTGLNLPDFRAWEKTFQLLTQVAGRAGRGELPGRVVVQTFDPENPAVDKAKTHDYIGFYNDEMHRRREFGYPPFSHLIRILVTGVDENQVTGGAHSLAKVLKKYFKAVPGEILGPAPAPLSKIRGRYRWHLVLKSAEMPIMKEATKKALSEFSRSNIGAKVALSVDVNPTGMI